MGVDKVGVDEVGINLLYIAHACSNIEFIYVFSIYVYYMLLVYFSIEN